MAERSDHSEFLRDVHLHGSLGEEFGSCHRIAVATPAEAVRALAVLHPGFRQAIVAGDWRIVRGNVETGMQIGEDALAFMLGLAPLHIVPVAVGAGGRNPGLGKVIGGLALAAGAFLAGPVGLGLFAAGSTGAMIAGDVVGIGLAMALQGASSLLTSKPAVANGRAGVDERTSFLFNGFDSTAVQGGCVPVAYGRIRISGITVSAGLMTAQI